eukprot:COSAG01_NODE_2013_length_8643_cov_30.224081_3_plen_84_part_00
MRIGSKTQPVREPATPPAPEELSVAGACARRPRPSAGPRGGRGPGRQRPATGASHAGGAVLTFAQQQQQLIEFSSSRQPAAAV